jgi:hypothetical protein
VRQRTQLAVQGQQAMALACIYPESEKRGRGNNSEAIKDEESSHFSRRLLQQAQEIVIYPDLRTKKTAPVERGHRVRGTYRSPHVGVIVFWTREMSAGRRPMRVARYLLAGLSV